MHRLAPGATSREMDVIARMTAARDRAAEPSVRLALGDGLELIRQLVAERHRRLDVFDRMDEARADDASWDGPCPDA